MQADRMTFDLCVTSPQPPSNDECAGATPLLIDPNLVCQSATTASTFGATQSVAGCSDKPINDIWFQFIATSSTSRLNVQMPGDWGSDYSFGMEILEGDCGTLMPYLECAEYGYGKIINLQNLVEGHTYFIRLYSFVNQARDFSICLTYLPPPPANDNCTQPELILANNGIDCIQKYFGTTLGATPSLLTCYGAPAQDVWYQFVATSAKHLIGLKSTGYPFGFTYYQLGFQIYEGGDCANLLPIVCYDNSDGQPTIVENLTIGNTYTVRVFTNEVDALEFSLCIRALPELPDNVNCLAAVEIVPSPNLECSTPVAGTTAGLTDIAYVGCYYGTGLWYKFTATSDQYLIRLQDTVQQYGAGFLGVEFLKDNCNNLYYANCSNNLEIYAFYLVPGTEYYIRVVGEQNSGVDFNLCVMTIVPPANDLCANATTVVPNIGLDCVNTSSGTTLGTTATDYLERDLWYDFTATSTSHAFEILNIEVISGSYSPSFNYEIYKGDNCDDLTLVAQLNTNEAAVSNQLVLGDHYFVRIYRSYAGWEANFDFCIKTLPTSPPNEYCAGAYELIPNTGLDCTIATSGTTEGAVEGQSCIINAGADVWYKFTATATAHVVSLFNISSPTGDILSVEVLQSTDCASFTSFGCNTYFNQGLIASGLTIGIVYYIRVANPIGAVYQYDICITTLPTPPNDRCENAEPLPISAWQSCEYSTNGTTYGATPTSGLTACGETGNDVWYSFTATQSAHTFTANSISGTLNVELLKGECGNLQHLECRNALYNGNPFTFGELIPGATYFLRVNTIGTATEFNICISTPPLPPANDACIDAVVLPVSPDETCVTLVSGTMQWASPSSNVPNSGSGNVSNDIWYTFTATGTNHLITVSNYYNYNSYLQLDAYSGDCGTLTLIGGQSLWSNNQLLLTNLMPGTPYTLRLYNPYYPANIITFDICVTSVTPPANDECTGALPLIANQTLNCLVQTNATGYGATPSMPDCNGMPTNDIWYQFTATSTSHALSTDAYQLGMEIFEGNCGALIPVVTCTILNNPKEIIQNLVVGNTYYIRFFFSGNIAPFDICLQALPVAPANDECAQAIVAQTNSGLDCTFSYEGSTLGATQSAPACDGSGTHDIWYQFTATNTTHLLDINATDPFNGDAKANYNIELYSGSDCDNLTSLTCTNPYYALIWNDLIVGNTYFVRIFSLQNTALDFTLCILTPPPPPANVDCSAAIEVIPSQDMNCSQPVSGTTGGLSWDETTGNWVSGTSLWYQFTATSNAHVVELQHIVPLYGYHYPVLELYEGTCDGLQLLGYYNKIIKSNLVPGNVYYVKVYGGSTNAAFNFDLCVLTVIPPTNITCLEAQPLQVWPANCEAATSSVLMGGDPYYPYYYNSCYTINSAWFKFEATDNTHFITVNQTALENIFSGLKYELFVGNCGQLTSIGCYPKYFDPYYQYFNPGTTYYVRVGSEQSPSALFDICISTPQPDLDLYAYQLPDNCTTGDNETLKIQMFNSGGKTIDIGDASISLAINGANTGNYGPYFNTTMIDPGSYEVVDLTGLDFSNNGINQMVANVALQYDRDLTNNTLKISFTGQNLINYYADGDGDGYGNAAQSFVSCVPIEGFVADNTDCDDTDVDIHPGATETCNGIDDDCNGLVDADDPNVQNTQTLVLTCPYNIIMENNTGTCSALVYYDLVVSDNCANTLTQDSGLPTGSLFPVGTTLNAFTITDPDGNQVACNFTVQVKKAAEPDLRYAYTVIGLNDVLMRGNTVLSGGVGVVNTNKKARLQLGTTVTGANSFVKAPILELQGGSQVTKYYNGQVPTALLPVFQANTTPSSNNISIPANSNAVTLGLASYGNIIVGSGTTVIFSGQSTVLIKELTIKAGAIILFNQSTTLLVNKGIAIAANADINPGGSQLVQFFAAENVTIERGCDVFAHIYTKKDLLLEKASALVPTNMTGSFIAFNVYAPEFVQWNWAENYCPTDPSRPSSPESERTTEHSITQSPVNGMRITPNPASSQAQVSFELENDTPITVQLMDATGRLVQTTQINGVKGINQMTLALSKLSEGLYTVRVRGQGYQSIGKLVISYP